MKNYWLSSGFYALLNQLFQMMFNLGTVFILWRVLDEKTCGVWALFLMITSFIEIGRTGLLQNGLVSFLNQTPQYEHAKINTASLFLSLSLSFLCVLLLVFGGNMISAYFDAAELAQLLMIYAATTFVLSGVYQFNFIQQANLDFKGLFWSGFVKNGLLFFYVLWIKLTNGSYDLKNLAFCQLIAAIPAALVAYGFARKYFVLDKKIDWSWVKKLFNYGKFTFGTNLATMAQKNVDKAMLGRFLLDKVSTYDLAIKVNNLAEVPTLTLASILFPQSAKRSNTEGVSATKYLYEKSVGVILAIILPMALFIIIFADWIILIIGSEKYASAAPVLRLTIFYSFFMAYAMQFGTILDSIGKPKLNFYITTLGAFVNLTLNYFFIKTFGLYGAAYGTLAGMTIMFGIMQVILNKMFGIQAWRAFGFIPVFYRDMLGKMKGFMRKKMVKTV